MDSPSESPSGRLRSSVRESPERLDRSDYAAAVTSGRLTLPRYTSFLRALYVLHDGLEQLLEHSGSPVLRAAFAESPARRERLERDLAYLQADKYAVDGAALQALVLVQQLRQRTRSPHGQSCLLGAIYVVEGSQLGGLAQARALARHPELERGGLAYLQGAGAGTSKQLRDLFQLLDEHLQDDAELAAAIEGATNTFSGFEAILTTVMAGAERLAESLNFAAGTHPVPRDLREVEAALRAGEQSRSELSYYERRYGERGRRFTRSDSAWLVTLSRVPEDEALQQVAWLARLLAARGMPRLLLERHLLTLHARLVAELPGSAAKYEILQRAAELLARERRALLSDTRFEALCAELESACQLQPGGATPPIPLREVGLLLAGAVVDEACAVPHAVESLCRWLTDSSRASLEFRAAVDHVVRTARSALA